MNNDHENDMSFPEFFAERLRSKGISLAKLSEVTGIAPVHLTNLFHGNFSDMPSKPYLRGYLIRIGRTLDFDGEEWWGRLEQEDTTKDAHMSDELPRNRFVRNRVPKSAWIAAVLIVILVGYFLFAFPYIFGKPILTVTYPAENPYVTSSATLTIQGTVRNADALYLVSNESSSSEEIIVAPDGSWEKGVLLGKGLNTFEISAEKFLGGETRVTQEIIYTLPLSASGTQPVIHFAPQIPATGTYFD